MSSITLIIPCFNSENYLSASLNSIASSTVMPDEIICIDDCSTDQTREIIAKADLPIQLLINDTNKGPAYSRNIGVKQSAGNYLTFLDSDDLVLPDKIEWQKTYLDTHPDVDIVIGQSVCFPVSDANDKRSTNHFNAYLGSMMIRRKVFDDIGLFDESLKLSEDQDWFLRVRESQLNTSYLERLALKVRLHENNLTKNLTFKETGLMAALKKSLDRRNETDVTTISTFGKKSQ